MPRTKTPAARRHADLELTKYVCSQIEHMSKLTPVELEAAMGFGGSLYRPSTPGQRWRRYAAGQCVLMPAVADHVVRKALLRGWWPLSDQDHPLWHIASAGVRSHIEAAKQGLPLEKEAIFSGARVWREQIERRKRNILANRRRLATSSKSAFEAARNLGAGQRSVPLTGYRGLGSARDVVPQDLQTDSGEDVVELLVCFTSKNGLHNLGYARLPMTDELKVTFDATAFRTIES